MIGLTEMDHCLPSSTYVSHHIMVFMLFLCLRFEDFFVNSTIPKHSIEICLSYTMSVIATLVIHYFASNIMEKFEQVP